MVARANRCDRKVDIGRRWFLSGAGVTAAGAAAATLVPNAAEATPQLARLSYPSNRLANIGDFKPNEPLQVAYPDANGRASSSSSAARFQAGLGPTGTSSDLRRFARTRDFRSGTIPRTRR